MEINKLTYFSYLSIKNNILNPLKKFMSYEEVISVAEKKRFKKKFFPMPFFLSANKEDLKSIQNNKIEIKFNNKTIDFLRVSSISIFKKDELIDKIFKNKKNVSDHPYFKFIRSSGNYLIETDEFSQKKINKKSKNKSYIGFATRNIPHKGHEKIILHYSKLNKI